MATTTNFGWETPDDTDLVKDGALAMRTLGNSIDSSFVDLKGGTTGQVLAKASNTDLDFSWVAVDPLTILDAKGDLISATAADTPARLAVGTNGHVLTADSTTATGLKWAAPAAGGKLLQVVSTTKTDTSSMSSNSFTATGLSVSITPTLSTSKILVFATCYFGVSNSNSLVGARLQRGSTVICVGAAAGSRPQGSGYADFMGHETRMLQSVAFHTLDEPATTSATTYEVYFRTYTSGGDTIYLNRSGTDRNTADYDWRLASTITAMEIGA